MLATTSLHDNPMSWGTGGGDIVDNMEENVFSPRHPPPLSWATPTMSWTTRCSPRCMPRRAPRHHSRFECTPRHPFISRHSHDMLNVPHDMGRGFTTTWCYGVVECIVEHILACRGQHDRGEHVVGNTNLHVVNRCRGGCRGKLYNHVVERIIPGMMSWGT